MVYEELEPASWEEAVSLLASGAPETISNALLRLALFADDRRRMLDECLRLSKHPDVWVRRNVATSLGHLAREFGGAGRAEVTAILRRLARDEAVAPWARHALSDLGESV